MYTTYIKNNYKKLDSIIYCCIKINYVLVNHSEHFIIVNILIQLLYLATFQISLLQYYT